MSDARATILDAIRRALGRDTTVSAETVRSDYAAALSGDAPRPVWSESTLERFQERFERAAGTVERIESNAEAVAAIHRYFDGANPGRIAIGGHPDLEAMDWPADWAVSVGPEGARECPVSVSRGYAGIAETGSLVMPAAPERPTTLNFLPDTAIVLLHASEIVDHMETVWEKLIAERGTLPRTVNTITGPSRTADVEQTLQLGAHGPRHLHLLLVV